VTLPVPLPDDLLARSLSRADLPDIGRSLALLARAQTGDRGALEDLVSRYQERLRRIVRIQLGSSLRRQYDSMDIVQSTFAAALPKIGDLHPRSAAGLLAWLALIATNQIRDAHDHVRAGKRDIAREDHAEDAQAATSAGGTRPGDEASLAVLRDYCGEDWDRIAIELDRDKGATRQLHQRAWIRLRRALRPRLEGHV